MNKQSFFKHSVTLGPLGRLPAPGTCATVATMPLVIFMMHCYVSAAWWTVISLVAVCIAYYCIAVALPQFPGKRDPQVIVLDEVVGTLITFTGIACSGTALFVGFALFRFFDIKKPFFIRWVERLPGVGGILLDDVLAGITANVVLRMVMHLSIQFS